TRFTLPTETLIPIAQGLIISQIPSITLIHSSHARKADSVTTSATIIKSPEITVACVAVGSRPNGKIQGERQSQMPSSQIHPSCQCLGGAAIIFAPALLSDRTLSEGFCFIVPILAC